MIFVTAEFCHCHVKEAIGNRNQVILSVCQKQPIYKTANMTDLAQALQFTDLGIVSGTQ